MKKICLFLLGSVVMLNTFAASSDISESSSQCQQVRQQMRKNHQAIDVAYHKNDACQMGKLMMQNRQAFESYPACFPKANKMMKKMQQQNAIAAQAVK